jgi:DNA helicase-2/ATP-dependent DNA helicase PcrA
MAPRVWSDQQQQIFRWFASGTGNLVVRARAGTGKTTTIVEALSHAPEKRILLCAFNKRIATELQGRLTNPAAEAATLHSVGFAAVRQYWERTRIDDKGARKEHLARQVCGDKVPDALVRLVAKLHTMGREMAAAATDWRELRPLAFAHDCVPDEEWADDGYDTDWVCARAIDAMNLAASVRPLATGIDFADMLFLPVRNKWLRPKYDLIVVDECQDMNETQLLIAQGVAKGRVVVVGDDKQAIYGFRGADSGSLDRLKTELEAQELGLTTTYRCGKAIVQEAQRLVPDFLAAPSNGEGRIETIPVSQLAAACAVGDFVLSRKNAPLATIALRILRAGKRAKIEGKDIGAGLRALVGKLSKGKATGSMPQFLAKLTTWESREVERASKSGDQTAEARIERVRDQAETIRALADGLSGVPELQARIDDLFSDSGGPRVICSSVHRAKGLEAERVFVLADTLLRELPCRCKHWAGVHDSGSGCSQCACKHYAEDAARKQEEQNIEYVAITRAKDTLVWVEGLP